ncbi:unnamed protein product [Closterium sp. NIES-54]
MENTVALGAGGTAGAGGAGGAAGAGGAGGTAGAEGAGAASSGGTTGGPGGIGATRGPGAAGAGGYGGSARGGGGYGSRQQLPCLPDTPTPQQLHEWVVQRGSPGGSVRCTYVKRTGLKKGETCGKTGHTEYRCFGRLEDAWRTEYRDEKEVPNSLGLLAKGVDVYALDFVQINKAIYAMYVDVISAEGACYLCVPWAAGVYAIAPGASESVAALGASASAATVTPLASPVLVSLADPTGGPVVARASNVLPCPAVTSGSLPILHLPSFLTNLQTGSSLYTLTTASAQVAASGQVAMSSQVSAFGQLAASCSCRVLTHQTLLWHHRLGHPSLPRLHSIHSRLLERYFLLVLDDYTRYTTVFPLRSKADIRGVLIPWIRATHRQLREWFRRDLTVLRLHSDKGGEFSSNLLADFCRDEGIAQSFTLPASPQHNGIAERRIGLIMEVARTSIIHAAAPHFLWPFAVRYAAHQLNLWPRASVPETSPTLRWRGEVGNASTFRVNGALSLVRNTTATKLSPRTLCCVDPSPLVEPLEVSFDTNGPAEGGDPAADDTVATRRSPRLETPPGFPPRPSSPPPQHVAVDTGAAGGGDTGGEDFGGAGPGGAETGGEGSGGAETGGAGSKGADSGGAAGPSGGGAVGALAGGPGVGQQQPPSRLETLSPQQLREWIVRQGRSVVGAWSFTGPRGTADNGGAGGTAGAGGGGGTARAGGAGAASFGGTIGGLGGTRATRVPGAAGAGGAGGTRATSAGGPGAAGAGGTGAAGAGGTGPAGAGAGGAGATGFGATGGARAAGAGGARGGGTGAAGVGGATAGGDGAADGTGTAPRRLFFYPQPQSSLPPSVSALRRVLSLSSSTGLTPPLMCPPSNPSQTQLPPGSPLPAPSSYTELPDSLTERREPESSASTPVRARRVARPRAPAVPGTHLMALRPSSDPQHVVLPSPPVSSLPHVPDPEPDRVRDVSPIVTRFRAMCVIDPLYSSLAATALVAELVDFAAMCHLDYAARLVFDSDCPQAIGDPDALDIPTPRTYVEAISGEYSFQWQTAMDAEMASWKSTGTYLDDVLPPVANIGDGMWIFRVKRPLGSPPAFKARYVAQGFSQRQGVNFFQIYPEDDQSSGTVARCSTA